MKCPKCQAKLLPVDGEMFCLQCGTAVAMRQGVEDGAPALEETTDPLLQKAIMDVVRKPVQFNLPVSQAPPVTPRTTAFTSMRSVLTPPRQALVPGGAAVMAPPSARINESQVSVSQLVAKVEPKRAGLWAGWHAPSLAWMAGLAVFVAFLIVNGAIFSFYANRVYPGVKVGQVDLGGMPLDSLRAKLQAMKTQSTLMVEAGGSKYQLDMNRAVRVDVERAEREIKAIGHSTPMPLAGVVQSLLSKPVALYEVTDEAVVRSELEKLAVTLSHKPSNAVPLVVNGQALVIAEKAGRELDVDKAVAEVRSGYGNAGSVKLAFKKVSPVVAASAYGNEIQEAQSMLALDLQINVRTATYGPNSVDIGKWLMFKAPGQGVTVDGAAVAAYVASLPGTFDRKAATTALTAAVQQKKNLSYKASTRKTAVPQLTSMISWPLISYGYCVKSDRQQDTEALRDKVTATVGQTGGWSLGGRLKFTSVEAGCNFTVELVSAQRMKDIEPGCAGRTTCQTGNELLINGESWQVVPDSWKSGLEAYRAEMINHEIGHWLGFDHASCSRQTAAPVLSAPALMVSGCSPNWYAVPTEVQGTKLLSAF